MSRHDGSQGFDRPNTQGKAPFGSCEFYPGAGGLYGSDRSQRQREDNPSESLAGGLGLRCCDLRRAASSGREGPASTDGESAAGALRHNIRVYPAKFHDSVQSPCVGWRADGRDLPQAAAYRKKGRTKIEHGGAEKGPSHRQRACLPGLSGAALRRDAPARDDGNFTRLVSAVHIRG